MTNQEINKKNIALKSIFGMFAILLVIHLLYMLYINIWNNFNPNFVGVDHNDKLGNAAQGILDFAILIPTLLIILPFFYFLSFIIFYFADKINKEISRFIVSFMKISVICWFAYIPTSLMFIELGRFVTGEQIMADNIYVSIFTMYSVLFYYFVWFKFIDKKV